MLEIQTTDYSTSYFAQKLTNEAIISEQSSESYGCGAYELVVWRGKKQKIKTRCVSSVISWFPVEGAEFDETRTADMRESTSHTHSLNKFIAARMADILAVERVYSAYRARVFYTWIILPDREQMTLREIYTRQQEIIDRFPEFEFDFYVLYKKQQPVQDMVSGDIELVFSREPA